MRSAIRPALLVLLMVVLGACRVDATVDVSVDADGSGRVAVQAFFDADATSTLDGLAERVFLADLRGAGWTVEPVEVRADGTTVLAAAKPFSDRAGLQDALDEIAGPGVFRNVRVEATDRFAERRQSLEFEIDLRDGWALFSDDDLTRALDGEPFGVPVERLTDGRVIDDVVNVSVQTSVRASPDDGDGAAVASFAPRFDDVAPTVVALEAGIEQSTAVLMRWVAWALTALAALSVVLFLLGLVMERSAAARRPVATPRRLASRIPGAADGPVDRRPVDAAPLRRPVRLLVVEPRTVLFEGDPSLDAEILAHVRAGGGAARADDVAAAIDDLLLGRIDSGDFWRAAQVDESHDDDELDAAVAAARVLRRSAPRLLRDAADRGLEVAAVSNDASSWAALAREAHRLHVVSPWFVSGDLGARKPDTGMFERLRRTTGVPYRQWLFVDTDVIHLDAARELGMRTVLFAPDGSQVPDVPGHPVASDLGQVLRRLD